MDNILQWAKKRIVSAAGNVRAESNGAIDVIAVRQPDGRILASPFHVHFDKKYGVALERERERLRGRRQQKEEEEEGSSDAAEDDSESEEEAEPEEGEGSSHGGGEERKEGDATGVGAGLLSPKRAEKEKLKRRKKQQKKQKSRRRRERKRRRRRKQTRTGGDGETVKMKVNGKDVRLVMWLGSFGEAFFLAPTTDRMAEDETSDASDPESETKTVDGGAQNTVEGEEEHKKTNAEDGEPNDKDEDNDTEQVQDLPEAVLVKQGRGDQATMPAATPVTTLPHAEGMLVPEEERAEHVAARLSEEYNAGGAAQDQAGSRDDGSEHQNSDDGHAETAEVMGGASSTGAGATGEASASAAPAPESSSSSWWFWNWGTLPEMEDHDSDSSGDVHREGERKPRSGSSDDGTKASRQSRESPGKDENDGDEASDRKTDSSQQPASHPPNADAQEEDISGKREDGNRDGSDDGVGGNGSDNGARDPENDRLRHGRHRRRPSGERDTRVTDSADDDSSLLISNNLLLRPAFRAEAFAAAVQRLHGLLLQRSPSAAVASIVPLQSCRMSMCGHIIRGSEARSTIYHVFCEHMLTPDGFAKVISSKILVNTRLVVWMANILLPYTVATQVLVSMATFGTVPDVDALRECLNIEYTRLRLEASIMATSSSSSSLRAVQQQQHGHGSEAAATAPWTVTQSQSHTAVLSTPVHPTSNLRSVSVGAPATHRAVGSVAVDEQKRMASDDIGHNPRQHTVAARHSRGSPGSRRPRAQSDLDWTHDSASVRQSERIASGSPAPLYTGAIAERGRSGSRSSSSGGSGGGRGAGEGSGSASGRPIPTQHQNGTNGLADLEQDQDQRSASLPPLPRTAPSTAAAHHRKSGSAVSAAVFEPGPLSPSPGSTAGAVQPAAWAASPLTESALRAKNATVTPGAGLPVWWGLEVGPFDECCTTDGAGSQHPDLQSSVRTSPGAGAGAGAGVAAASATTPSAGSTGNGAEGVDPRAGTPVVDPAAASAVAAAASSVGTNTGIGAAAAPPPPPAEISTATPSVAATVTDGHSTARVPLAIAPGIAFDPTTTTTSNRAMLRPAASTVLAVATASPGGGGGAVGSPIGIGGGVSAGAGAFHEDADDGSDVLSVDDTGRPRGSSVSSTEFHEAPDHMSVTDTGPRHDNPDDSPGSPRRTHRSFSSTSSSSRHRSQQDDMIAAATEGAGMEQGYEQETAYDGDGDVDGGNRNEDDEEEEEREDQEQNNAREKDAGDDDDDDDEDDDDEDDDDVHIPAAADVSLDEIAPDPPVGGLSMSEDSDVDSLKQEGNRASRYRYRKSLIATSEQLASLGLEAGPNTVEFSVRGGECAVFATIYLWSWSDRIVVSDIDGPIVTKSSVFGTIIGSRLRSHRGVAQLFSNIAGQGYRILYVASRLMTHIRSTKGNLEQLKDEDNDNVRLPSGPVFLSPMTLVRSQDDTGRMTLFKQAALQTVVRLFPKPHNALFAGFGVGEPDLVVYKRAGVPEGRIFLVNKDGEVQSVNRTFRKTYSNLNDLVQQIFPALVHQDAQAGCRSFYQSRAGTDDCYSDVNFWRIPVPVIDLMQAKAEAEAKARAAASGASAGQDVKSPSRS